MFTIFYLILFLLDVNSHFILVLFAFLSFDL